MVDAILLTTTLNNEAEHMYFFKNTTRCIGAVVFIATLMGMTALYASEVTEQIFLTENHNWEQTNLDLELRTIMQNDRRMREAQAILVARAFYGEYRSNTVNEDGEIDPVLSVANRRLGWQMKFSAIMNRLEYRGDWSDDFVATMEWGCETLCQINGLPLVGEEQLLGPIGQEALTVAREMVAGLHNGFFEPLHVGHSWATPAAAEKNSWFQTLCQVAEGPVHQYFADCPEETVVLAADSDQKPKLKKSLRPKIRPTITQPPVDPVAEIIANDVAVGM